MAVGLGSALLTQAAPGCGGQPPTGERPSLGAEWYGYGGVGDYQLSHGNTPEAVTTAHRIRDGEFDRLPPTFSSIDAFDLVIVGGGMAGLGAALEFAKQRRPGQTCLLLDNHPVFGGEAKENEFDVGGTQLIGPQGANGFFVPPLVDDPSQASGDARYYTELAIPREFSYADWPRNEAPLGFCQDNYGYLVRGLQENTSVGHFFETGGRPGGGWATDMWRHHLRNTPLPEAHRRSLLTWYHSGASRAFASVDAARRRLDTMSYREYLERELGMGPEGADYADLFLASACGLGSDVVSAFAAYDLPMPGLSESPPPSLHRHSFPGGNSGYARYFIKALIPEAIAGGREFADVITGKIRFSELDRAGRPLRIRLESTVVRVVHDGDPPTSGGVTVAYVRGNKLHAVKARAVVMATGGWINRHVVGDMPAAHREAYGKFHHAPFLVANVALTNWRFLYKLGITAAIWNKGAGDFGYTCNIRRPMHAGDYRPPLDPSRPTILSFYTPFYYPGLPIAQQVAMGRMELLNTAYRDYEQKILRQMLKLFGSAGFDPAQDVAGIILNRWGHAYSVPYPGFYGGAGGDQAPRDIIRRSYGRVAFGHSELNGLQHWGPAADEGRRAVQQVSDAL